MCFLLLSGCTKEKRTEDNSNSMSNPPGAFNLASLQTDIFALGCATSGCHGNINPQASLNMSTPAQTHAHLVNRNSIQANPSLKLVEPNNPGASYLINKLQSTHLNVGGTGYRMPPYAVLTTEEFDRIVAWINDGAPLN